jgi:hypothetical protein
MSEIPEYIQGADIPDLTITWLDQAGDVIDYSSGYTFSLKLGQPGQAAALTKSTGITGAATSPNITVTWAASNELNTLDAGTYTLDVIATRAADSKQRIMRRELRVKAAIT